MSVPKTRPEDALTERPLDRDPYMLETSQPGVFVAGDLRKRSIERLASAVGEDALAGQFVHQLSSPTGCKRHGTLPGASGARRRRARPAHERANAEDLDALDEPLSGARFLPKPWSITDLLHRVREVLDEGLAAAS